MSLGVGDQMAPAQWDVLLQAVAAFPHLQTSIFYFYVCSFLFCFFSQGGADSSRANVSLLAGGSSLPVPFYGPVHTLLLQPLQAGLSE